MANCPAGATVLEVSLSSRAALGEGCAFAHEAANLICLARSQWAGAVVSAPEASTR